jgi:tryptophan synthase beta subunit
MNKRVDELWSRAAEAVAACPGGNSNSWEAQVNFMHKFAELLVQECAGVIADAVEGREPASTYVEKIREHFGVEL